MVRHNKYFKHMVHVSIRQRTRPGQAKHGLYSQWSKKEICCLFHTTKYKVHFCHQHSYLQWQSSLVFSINRSIFGMKKYDFLSFAGIMDNIVNLETNHIFRRWFPINVIEGVFSIDFVNRFLRIWFFGTL